MKAQRLMFPQILNSTHPTPRLKISTCASSVLIFPSDFSAPWAAGLCCRIESRRDCRYHYCSQKQTPSLREIVMVDLGLLPIVIKWEDGSEETYDAVESPHLFCRRSSNPPSSSLNQPS